MIAVLFNRGADWDADRPLSEQSYFDEHLAYLSDLRDRGVVTEFGPLVDPTELTGKAPLGLALLDLISTADAETVIAADPMLRREVLTASVHLWHERPNRGGTT